MRWLAAVASSFGVIIMPRVTLRLQADLSRRLGNLRGGSADIRKHPFFKVMRDMRLVCLRCGGVTLGGRASTGTAS